jgi:hypothetical protein
MDEIDRAYRRLRRKFRKLELENIELRILVAELLRPTQKPAFENVTVIIEPTKQQMAQRH